MTEQTIAKCVENTIKAKLEEFDVRFANRISPSKHVVNAYRDDIKSHLLSTITAVLSSLEEEVGRSDIEALAEKVHQAYLTTCERLGWEVKESNKVPYADLTEDSKELDRASVRAVLTDTQSRIREIKKFVQNYD